MKKLISLSLMLSLGLAMISPALNAAQAQTMRQRASAAMPAWTQSSGFEAAKKWWHAGRNMNALTPQEQKAFTALKAKVGITAIIAILTAIAATIGYKMRKPIATPESIALEGLKADLKSNLDSMSQKHGTDVVKTVMDLMEFAIVAQKREPSMIEPIKLKVELSKMLYRGLEDAVINAMDEIISELRPNESEKILGYLNDAIKKYNLFGY